MTEFMGAAESRLLVSSHNQMQIFRYGGKERFKMLTPQLGLISQFLVDRVKLT